MVFRKELVLACILGVAGAAPASDGPSFLRYTLTGERDGDFYGRALAGMGDLDGDGVPDFALGSIEYLEAEDATGKVLLVSGKTGETIRTLRSGEELRHFGQNVASAGDIDADGVNDLLAAGPGRVEQRSGKTGDLLGIVRDRTYNTTGVALASVGDVNQDGVPDFAVGNWRPQDSRTSRVHVHSGASPQEELWMRVGEDPGDGFGGAVMGPGDVNEDGVPDVAVGAPYTPDGEGAGGTVFLLSGGDGTEIRRLRLGVPSDAFGLEIHGVSDLDGDGIRELAISAASYPVRGFRGAGRVSVHAGATGDVIWARTGQDFNREAFGSYFGGDVFGAALANVGDADGDGADDLAAWSVRAAISSFDSSRVTLVSGRSGALLAAYEREESDTRFGQVLAGLGDIDGDGRSEFLIGAPDLDVRDIRAPGGVAAYYAGRAYAVSYVPEEKAFIRSDADLDGDTDLTDAVAILEHLFRGKPGGCEDAMDVDRSLQVDVTDAAIILVHLFGAGYAPEPPFPDCGRLHAFRRSLPCERSSCQ